MRADTHSHLLFGMDDGCQTREESVALLQHLQESGVTHLALTPHYYTYEISLSRFLQKRERARRAFEELPIASQFQLSVGAEVYFNEMLFNETDLSPLCYEGTRLMLVELKPSIDRLTGTLLRRLDRLMNEYEVVPVLAHLNRYQALYRPEIIYELRSLGCLVQINLDAALSLRQRRRTVRLIREGFIDFLGEDLHQLPPTSKAREKALRYLEKKTPNFLETADENAFRQIFS